MENFTHYNPTKILFGKNEIEKVAVECLPYGQTAIILLGKGSAKKHGIYARLISLLNMHQIKFITYEGIKSNPTYQDADAAVKLAKDNNVDFIIALGGGSVIDTAKAVAMGYYVEHTVWDFYMQKVERPSKALPIISILTLAATGTEMNSSTVIQDTDGGMKKGYGSPLLFPKVSILDPELTYSVPANYTAFGIADLMAHALEVFFGLGDAPLSDHYISSILKLAIQFGPTTIEEPENYDARANIMWLASNALNGTILNGRGTGDWGCHGLEHTLSVLYDIPHGAGLSIVYPAWLKYHFSKIKSRLAFLAKNVFELHTGTEEELALQFIEKLENYFNILNTPIKLSEYQIPATDHQKIIDNLILNNITGRVYPLNSDDYDGIVKLMW
jgi:alcohol dehydrogenase YqhD (iron-dependent ADH family)